MDIEAGPMRDAHELKLARSISLPITVGLILLTCGILVAGDMVADAIRDR